MSIEVINGRAFSWTGNLGVSESSTLGFPPGEAPETLVVKSHKTGRSLHFKRTSERTRGDDVTYHVYASSVGVTLHVYED